MKNDPIVDEVRRVRAELFEACENDLDKLLDSYQQAEEKDQKRVVSLDAFRAKRKILSPTK
jgi:hypothetical protein